MPERSGGRAFSAGLRGGPPNAVIMLSVRLHLPGPKDAALPVLGAVEAAVGEAPVHGEAANMALVAWWDRDDLDEASELCWRALRAAHLAGGRRPGTFATVVDTWDGVEAIVLREQIA